MSGIWFEGNTRKEHINALEHHIKQLTAERDELAEKVKKHEMAFNPIQQMEWLRANLNFDPDLVNDLNDARIMINALIQALGESWVRHSQEKERCAVIAETFQHTCSCHTQKLIASRIRGDCQV